jgi:hypothetical protein
MKAFGNSIRVGIVTALLFGGVTTGAQGFVGGMGSGPIGGSARGLTQIRGTVVCAQCGLDGVRETQPQRKHFYELTHKQDQVVMEVTRVNDPQMPIVLTSSSPRLSVRAPDRVFQQLTAEENMFKEVEIVGLLNNTNTFDVFEVVVHG